MAHATLERVKMYHRYHDLKSMEREAREGRVSDSLSVANQTADSGHEFNANQKISRTKIVTSHIPTVFASKSMPALRRCSSVTKRSSAWSKWASDDLEKYRRTRCRRRRSSDDMFRTGLNAKFDTFNMDAKKRKKSLETLVSRTNDANGTKEEDSGTERGLQNYMSAEDIQLDEDPMVNSILLDLYQNSVRDASSEFTNETNEGHISIDEELLDDIIISIVTSGKETN